MGCPLAEAPPLVLLPPEEGGVVQGAVHRRPVPLLEVPLVRGR